MWRADAPVCTAIEVATACVRGVRDRGLRDAVLAGLGHIESNSDSYRDLGEADSLHEIAQQGYSIPNVTARSMKWLYEDRLARPSSAARRYYDQIMIGAPLGLCVYCRHSEAATLDHFAPKAHHPTLAIEPMNLVPACLRCNNRLRDDWSSEPVEQMLHPYFMPEAGRWLFATIEHVDPVVVRFEARPSPGLSSDLRQRVAGAFEKLQLASFFATNSAAELTGLGRRLSSSQEAMAGIRAFLSEAAEVGFASDVNDRRGAMYEALALDDWYCSGGYRSFAP